MSICSIVLNLRYGTFIALISVHNSRVKRAWAGVVKGWVTYREVIRDSVRVRPKHGKRSGGDCRISKQ
ncbi:hypothetical protein YC2023_081499 [Brassica napus]